MWRTGGAPRKAEEREGEEEVGEEEEGATDKGTWEGRPGRWPRRRGESWQRRHLERAPRGAEMAGLARGGQLGAPRAPLPRGDRPRVRRRHERRCSPGEGQSGQGPGVEAWGGGGAALAPGSAPAPADSQPSFFPSPAPGPGRRGGGCSPLCNRGVKKCEKRALCYLFGSRKFMPS